MPDTRERLRAVVEKVADKRVPQDPDESLFESGILDSFMIEDLVTAIEVEFCIKIRNSDVHPRKFDSLSRIEACLLSNSPQNEPGGQPA